MASTVLPRPLQLTLSHPDERVRVPITTTHCLILTMSPILTHFFSSWRACESTDYHNSLYLILTMGFILTTIHCLILTMSSSSPQFTLSHPDHEFHPLHNSLCLILTSVRVPIPTTHLISSWPWVHPHHNSLYLILTHFFSSWRAWGYRSPQFTVSLWPWVPSSLTSSHPDEREGTDHHN